jgi:4-aminobutyrate aminotransferase/(S)-3-amino-2-methylpropionate transaminase
MAGMPPILWDQAEGFLVRDAYGNQWIDLTSGIVVANTGHGCPEVLDAIRHQLDSRLVFSYAFATNIRTQLLERLVEIAPDGLEKAILFSSGTEATECAMALMRKHGLKISPEKVGIISIEQSYHGRTLSARFAGGAPGPVDGLNRQSVFHMQLPVPGNAGSKGFVADIISRGIDPGKVAGVILESIPGWSTMLYPQAEMDRLIEWAARHKVLIAADEVQAGMGRTGKMFAFEHYGIRPDVIACGKGLSSSLPISAVIGRSEIMDLAAPGEMSSTFGGNPVCVAAALANLNVIARDCLAERSSSLGEELGAALEKIAARHRRYIRPVNGKGLFYSLHLRNPETDEPLSVTCDQIVLSCVRKGVMLFLTGRGFLKIVPPLMIDRDALFEAVGVISEVLDATLEK